MPLLLAVGSARGFEACAYDGAAAWSARRYLALVDCDPSDPHFRWTVPVGGETGPVVSAADDGGLRLSTVTDARAARVVAGDDGSAWALAANGTLRVAAAAAGTPRDGGVGACLDLYGGSNPVDVWACHPAGHKDAPNQKWTYDATDGTLRSPLRAGKCVALNASRVNPWVAAPCAWPNAPPRGAPAASAALAGLALLENATSIPGYGADTFYPAEDRFGRFVSGFDDGGVGAVTVDSMSPTGLGSTTGAAIVTGGSNWRNLTVAAVGGAIVEDGFPMLGRYTSANFVANGTWWTGSYGLGLSTATNALSIELGPFVGFRWSADDGATWRAPRTPAGAALNVSHNLWGERAALGPARRGDPIDGAPRGDPAGVKMGTPHAVDHGPENARSPDGKWYVVAGGCLATRANENCTWISGDGIFVARASNVDATKPDSLNDAANWEFWGGPRGWVAAVDAAVPAFSWPGRVGAVTATWAPELGRYFFCVTAPHAHAWANEGPYDTYVLEAPSLVGPFRLVTYMPKFGQEAYFVSMPSAWLGPGKHDAVLTFSANFACAIEGCVPNIRGATYGASLLPVRFLPREDDSTYDSPP